MSQSTLQVLPRADVRWHISMTPRETADFIQKLATNDAFRDTLENDPQQVLAQYHIFLPHGHFSTPVTIPSKQDLQNALYAFATKAVPGISGTQTEIAIKSVTAGEASFGGSFGSTGLKNISKLSELRTN